jgi:hypothetical protein
MGGTGFFVGALDGALVVGTFEGAEGEGDVVVGSSASHTLSRMHINKKKRKINFIKCCEVVKSC